MTIPTWIQSAIFYQIFPDRFSNGDKSYDPVNVHPWEDKPTSQSFFGGDLKGIETKLSHITDLGGNAIYLNPIFLSSSTHRYNTTDYFKIDYKLGNLGSFHSLIRECHKKNIKVILDGVFNHCGRGFFAFSDVLENGINSPYKDWFNIRKFPLDAYSPGDALDYEGWWKHKSLPKLNLFNQEVRNYIFRVADYWIAEGADGWRLDVPNEIDDDEFWLEFRNIVKSANPEAYLVGEIWDINRRWVGDTHFDGLMNYPFRSAVIDVVSKKISPFDYSFRIKEILDAYPQENHYAMLNLLGSHDVERIISIFGNDLDKLKQAIFLQMMAVGCPCVYYGDEIGLEGGKDPDCRRTMPWDRNTWNLEVLNWTKLMIHIRKQHDAIMRGDYQMLSFSTYPDLIGFIRSLGGEKIIGLVNTSDGTLNLTTELFQPIVNPQERFFDLISKNDYDNQKNIKINAAEMLLLKIKSV